VTWVKQTQLNFACFSLLIVKICRSFHFYRALSFFYTYHVLLKINALVIWRCFAAVKTIISGMLASLIAPADKYKQEL